MASDRIESLIARMSVEEKVGQLGVFADMVRPFAPDVNPEANVRNAEQVLEQVRAGRVGSLFNGVGAQAGRRIQQVAVEESRLGIPVILAADVIHGMRTVFPIPLGEAASFEPELARRTARATAIEATAAGIHWTYAPAVDIARDQRWGRGAEGAGEDVVLGTAFAVARVRGFQGDDLKAEDALLSTPKHFAAYGAVAAGMEYAQVDISPQTLRDTHLPPFKAALEAGALSVMSAFNDINGVPASANRALLTELLRDEWKFEGVVVSDYTADMELIAHGYAADEVDATRKAFMAGLDLSMQSGFYDQHLAGLVEAGEVPMAVLDASVRRILRLKEAIGLFDDPYRSLDPAREADQSHIAAHDALSRDAARRSIVLLKNDAAVLPLKKQGQKIALIGPFVQDRDNIEGCWTLFGDKTRYVTLESGVRAGLGDDSLLEIVPGCGLEGPLDGGIEAAVAAARRADVAVLALGEPQRYTGEAQSRVELTLPPAQQVLAEAVAATGTPVVVLLRNGRALALQGAVRDAQAIAVTWYLGTQTGPAVADVLFGDYSPSARLPVSFPLASGQQPFFYNRPRSGRPELPGITEFKSRWREIPDAPLYAFGHGLAYTTFAYDAPRLSTPQLDWDGELVISTTLTNSGRVAGEEVVQLYVHDRVASRVRPMRELKDFRKIALAPGESTSVQFRVRREQLAFTGVDGVFRAEPGLFDVWVCASSASGEPVTFELLAP
ncbi:beta-glucosidase [Stenotrophomonas humi]|uniref:beta-glucosidase n=1 Tax=Stenotrophomonas humi TaxID=405444 RepID=A0A0R0C2V1_9GAMM|nr:glycoside hydrolase family 3 N-terminal domain-containing protein [Stenotrophomonas humi]KRG64205.1 beta-glucosidase [Stenotrophomonas humi]